MFKKSKEYQEIKKEFLKTKTLHKPMNFSCYHDGIIVFVINLENGYLQELSLITTDVIINKDTPRDILELEFVDYVGYRHFKEEMDIVKSIDWSSNKTKFIMN